MSESDVDDCSEAYKNPSCPYVTQININTACMKQVDRALISLLGKDGTGLNDGVIHRMLLKLDDLEAKNKVSASWLGISLLFVCLRCQTLAVQGLKNS